MRPALQLAALSWLLVCLLACEERQPRTLEEELTRAESMLAYRDFGGAVTHFRKALGLERSPRALEGLGLAYAALGQQQQAVAALSEARDGLPDDAPLRLALASTLHLLGRRDEAMAELEGAIAIDAALLPAHVLAGALAETPAERQRVAARMQALDRGGPSTAAELLITLGALRARAGEEAASQRLYHRARAAAVASPAITLTAADVHLRAGRPEVAQALLQALARGVPMLTLAHMKLSTVALDRGDLSVADRALRALPQVAADAPPGRLLRGRILAATGHHAEAVQMLEQALAALPPDAPELSARIALAQARAGTGASAEALQGLRALASRRPQSAQLQRAIAELQRRSGDRPGAEHTLTRLAALPAERADAFAALVQLQLQAGDAQAARRTATRWAQAEPRSPRPRLSLSRIEGVLGQPAEARTEAERAVLLSPRAVQPLRRALSLQLRAGEVAAADTRLQAALAAEPSRPELWLLAGDLLAAQGRFGAAEQHYARALSLSPDAPGPWVRVARYRAARGDAAGAEAALSTALSVYPQYTDALLLRAHLRFLLGPRDAARAAYEAAGPAAELDPRALADLAALHARPGGDRAAALWCARRALQLSSDFEGIERVRALLDSDG